MTAIAIARRSPRVRAVGIIVAAGVLALASQFALPVPGTPVPITLQPMIVVLAGLMLGPVDAAVAMLMYLMAGAAGLPVFAPMGAPGMLRLLGPTGGYLLAYPVAAAFAGLFGVREKSFVTRALAAEAGMLVLYLGGLLQLAAISGSVATAAIIGVVPFVAADAVKALLAAAIAGGYRRGS